jgi:translation initiation factor IF-2
MRVKAELGGAGIAVEDLGGEVPCVEVSGLTGKGLDDLTETLSAVAEMKELKAEREGRVEGAILESRKETGRGCVARSLSMFFSLLVTP